MRVLDTVYNNMEQNMAEDGGSRFYELDKRVALLEQAQMNIQKELHSISANLSKLVWVVITAVIVGIMNLIMTKGSVMP